MGKKGGKEIHRPPLTKMERVDTVRDTFQFIGKSKLYEGLKNAWGREKAGLGVDLNSYFAASDQAVSMIYSHPDILDHYAMKPDKHGNWYDPIKENNIVLGQVETIIYFWANPWLVAEEIIGLDNLNKAAVLARKFVAFTQFQKLFLRDYLDPRVHNMIFIACRSAGKTWLTALAMLIKSYLAPSINLMVMSGSQEQSDNLYKYYADMTTKTRYEDFIEKQTRLRTFTRAGGWIRSFPASHKAVHGPRPDDVIIDEACKAESDIIMAGMSAAMSAKTPKFMVMTTPDKMVHIVHEWWRQAQEQAEMTPEELENVPIQARWKMYHLSAFDCHWISSEVIENLTYKYGGRNTHEYKIYVLGQFAPAEGLVFIEENINDSLISKLLDTIQVPVELEDGSIIFSEEEPVYSFYTTGLDAGSKHPSAIITACEDQVGNIYIIDDEEIKGRMGDEPIIQASFDQAKKYWSHIYADAAPVQTFLNQKLRSKLKEVSLPGLSVIPFNKNKLPMISAVKGMFEAGILFIVGKPGCKAEKLVNQLYTYAYEDNENSEMPMKGNDDHVDAFLLACWPHRNTFLNRVYRKAQLKTYNMNEILEPVPDPYALTNPFNSQ